MHRQNALPLQRVSNSLEHASGQTSFGRLKTHAAVPAFHVLPDPDVISLIIRTGITVCLPRPPKPPFATATHSFAGVKHQPRQLPRWGAVILRLRACASLPLLSRRHWIQRHHFHARLAVRAWPTAARKLPAFAVRDHALEQVHRVLCWACCSRSFCSILTVRTRG